MRIHYVELVQSVETSPDAMIAEPLAFIEPQVGSAIATIEIDVFRIDKEIPNLQDKMLRAVFWNPPTWKEFGNS